MTKVGQETFGVGDNYLFINVSEHRHKYLIKSLEEKNKGIYVCLWDGKEL